MKKYLTFCILFLVYISANAAFKVRKTVEFKENSTELTEDGEAAMAEFALYAHDFVVEKIDIAAQCRLSEISFNELQLSRERGQLVHDRLAAMLPQGGDYEIRSYDRPEFLLAGEELGNCVLVTAYFIDEEGPELTHPEITLFPEEFDGFREIPAEFESYSDASSFVINNILFEGNSSVCLDQSIPTLEALVRFMQANPQIKVELEGHVNGNLGRRYLRLAAKTNPERKVYKNAKHLSLARAETVRDFLVMNGIAESRIVCIGKGGSEKRYKRPKNTRENEANRRIEINIIQ